MHGSNPAGSPMETETREPDPVLLDWVDEAEEQLEQHYSQDVLLVKEEKEPEP